jgi:hypothetical protein
MDKAHADCPLHAYHASFSHHLHSLLGGVTVAEHTLSHRSGYILIWRAGLEWVVGLTGLYAAPWLFFPPRSRFSFVAPCILLDSCLFENVVNSSALFSDIIALHTEILSIRYTKVTDCVKADHCLSIGLIVQSIATSHFSFRTRGSREVEKRINSLASHTWDTCLTAARGRDKH